MEKFLEHYFQLQSLLLTFPYRLKWEPGLKVYLELPSGHPRWIRYYVWEAILLLIFAYTCAVLFYLVKHCVHLELPSPQLGPREGSGPAWKRVDWDDQAFGNR